MQLFDLMELKRVGWMRMGCGLMWCAFHDGSCVFRLFALITVISQC